MGLVETLPATDYGFIVDQQPLGAKLFRQFCADTHKEYHRYNYFLDAVETYELELEDTRVKSASNIIKVYQCRYPQCHQVSKSVWLALSKGSLFCAFQLALFMKG